MRDLFRDACTALVRRGGEQLHRQIGSFVRQQIEAGALRPGDPIPPQRELSQIMRIGEVTIRRALQELADEGLLEARPRSGTFVLEPGKPTGRSRPRGRPSQLLTLGIAFADLTDGYPFFKPMLEGIRSEGERAAIRLFDLPGSMSPSDLRGLDGLVMMSPIDLNLVEKCHLAKVPCVLLYADVADGRTHCIVVDYAPAVLQAITQLKTKRRQRVALVTAGLERFSTGQLTDAYRTALEMNGLPFEAARILHAGYHERDGYEAMKTLLKQRPRPDAVICASDYQARGAMLAIQDTGLKVASDIAVIGAGRLLDDGGWPVPVSTIDLKFAEVGAIARQTIEALRRRKSPSRRQSVRSSFRPGATG
ncbi:MAG: GntR family transcriptional regulator [Tepidisphaeraceae bacterium]